MEIYKICSNTLKVSEGERTPQEPPAFPSGLLDTTHDRETSEGPLFFHTLNTVKTYLAPFQIKRIGCDSSSCTPWVIMCPLLWRPRSPPVFLNSGCTLNHLWSAKPWPPPRPIKS